MKVVNAIKKLEKAGCEVVKDACHYSAEINNQVIEFCQNGGGSDQVIAIRVRSLNDRDDTMTDYCAGVFCDNISQALRLANY